MEPADKEYFAGFTVDALYTACGKKDRSTADTDLIDRFNHYYLHGVDTKAAAMD